MKKGLLILFVLLSFVLINSGCTKKEPSFDSVPRAKQNQKVEKDQPNALDYMAPGYRQSQEKLKQLQDIRKKAIEENNIDY